MARYNKNDDSFGHCPSSSVSSAAFRKLYLLPSSRVKLLNQLSGAPVAVKRRAVEPVNKVEFPSVLCHEAIWSNGGMSPPLLTSALDGGEWSASRLCCFTPREIAHRIEG
jgi:hypothetical protein